LKKQGNFFYIGFFNPVNFFEEKSRSSPKKYYWGSGTNIFFFEYKDNIFFCCLQTFFITGMCEFKKNEKKFGGFKNRRKVKIYYWGIGMNVFFLQHKDNIFFCCIQIFFITGVTFYDRRKILLKTFLG